MKQVLLRSASAMLIAFAVGIGFGYPRFLEFDEYKRQVQPTDLSGRLEYDSAALLQDDGPADLSEVASIVDGEIP